MSQPQTRGSILIVDDTPANLRLLAQLLGEQGYEVRALPRGQLVRASVEASVPDLILLDITMPEMNGYEVCEQLKANASSRDIPIIFISALDDVQDKVKAFTTGGVDYITKPFKHEEVIARVGTHLALRQLQHTLTGQNLQLQQTTGQLQAITEALTRFLHTRDHGEASARLLDCALEQTQSRFGFIGMVLDPVQPQSRVQIVTLRGHFDTTAFGDWPLLDAVRKDMQAEGSQGRSEQSLVELEDRIGPVVSSARVRLAKRDGRPLSEAAQDAVADARFALLPPFYGAPIVQGDEVVGLLIVTAGHDPTDGGAKLTRIDRLAQAAGVLFEYQRLRQREARSERDRERAEAQVRYLEDTLKREHHFGEIVGRSTALRHVLAQVKRVAKTDSTVMIQGETGTGKELIARAIHERSARRDRPLIKVNCAALPENLIESELFGHEKGAFTGATARRQGRFELADGGTLFLDEIGDMPLATQVKLLRALQEQQFERLGGTKTLSVDVRVLAATHRDLKAMAADDQFREDLYYRLNVFPITMPALRERREDIVPLVEFFVQRLAGKFGLRITAINDATVERLQAYDWPGNIRELENIIERALILTNGEILDIAPEVLALPLQPQSATPNSATSPPQQSKPDAADQPIETLAEAERQHILRALAATHWALGGDQGAAALLGLNVSTLRNRMRKLNIRRSSAAE